MERGKRRELGLYEDASIVKYYSDAFKRYNTIKGIWGSCEGLRWYQKLIAVIQIKWFNLKNHFTNPYVKAMRRFIRQ